jgi:plastocyanin
MKATLRSRTAALVGTALLLVAVLVLADLPGGGPTNSDAWEVVLQDHRFEPGEVAVPAGRPVTLTFDNRDEVTHDVSIGRHVAEHDGRAIGFGEDLLHGIPLRVTPRSALRTPQPPYQGTTIAVRGGQRVEVELTVPTERVGEWQLGCFTGRGCHYQAGLAATLHVR